MPYVDSGEARIWYTEQGSGFPMLTLAPGGMRSSVSLWEMAAINPLTAYAGQYKMIAMDQRNAGQSTGPLETGDPWGAYAADQLAVMDHLGIDRFLVFGCCIGGPFILKLCELAPERVVAAVLEQPVGIIGATGSSLTTSGSSGVSGSRQRDDLGSDEIEAFATAMWAPGFAVSVTRDRCGPSACRCSSCPESMSTTRPRPAARSPRSRRPPSCSSRGRTPSTSRRHRSSRPVPPRPHPALDPQRVAPGPVGGVLRATMPERFGAPAACPATQRRRSHRA